MKTCIHWLTPFDTDSSQPEGETGSSVRYRHGEPFNPSRDAPDRGAETAGIRCVNVTAYLFDTKELTYMDTEPIEYFAVDHSKVFATEQGQSLLRQITSIIAGDEKQRQKCARKKTAYANYSS